MPVVVLWTSRKYEPCAIAAAEKIVTTGRRDAAGVEITSGLVAGEQIVEDPGNIVVGQALTTTDVTDD